MVFGAKKMGECNCQQSQEQLFQYIKDNYWQVRRGSSAMLSSICRQLGFGIGSVLLINDYFNNTDSIRFLSKLVITTLVIFFICDACQYLVQNFKYAKLAKDFEAKVDAKKIIQLNDLKPPKDLEKIPTMLFGMKIIAISTASIVFIILLWLT